MFDSLEVFIVLSNNSHWQNDAIAVIIWWNWLIENINSILKFLSAIEITEYRFELPTVSISIGVHMYVNDGNLWVFFFALIALYINKVHIPYLKQAEWQALTNHMFNAVHCISERMFYIFF